MVARARELLFALTHLVDELPQTDMRSVEPHRLTGAEPRLPGQLRGCRQDCDR